MFSLGESGIGWSEGLRAEIAAQTASGQAATSRRVVAGATHSLYAYWPSMDQTGAPSYYRWLVNMKSVGRGILPVSNSDGSPAHEIPGSFSSEAAALAAKQRFDAEEAQRKNAVAQKYAQRFSSTPPAQPFAPEHVPLFDQPRETPIHQKPLFWVAASAAAVSVFLLWRRKR